ncbi:MAG: glycosyltransferase [Planctomycetota bacterium]
MKIAQVSFAETGGGAERVATDLHDCFLQAGHDALLVTPRPDSTSRRSGVIPIDLDVGRGLWERAFKKIDRRLARPRAAMQRRRGFDDPHHPWTARLLELLPWTPDVLHLHNLHGNWFDLRQLGPLSRRVPTVITLHDAWLPLSGPHWPMHVEQWDPAALKANEALREGALSDAPVTVVSPSRWMKGVWDASPWSLKAGDAVVIPNGIDLEVFNPRVRPASRQGLGGVSTRPLLLQVGLTGRGTPSHTCPELLLDLAATLNGQTSCAIAVANVGERWGKDRLRAFGFADDSCDVIQPGRVSDRSQLASLYKSSDLLVHSVREDNFPSVVLEAMACGTPVVVANTGGIPEQLDEGKHGRFFDWIGDNMAASTFYLLDEVRSLLEQSGLCDEMGRNAAEHARQHFDRRRMADDYLALYAEIQR